ncbi:MAG: hypothetical protein Q8918_15175 [Bacteroidota bacterium]|nr:hypothetical protein [Bacteroidota bacterium]
MIKTVRLLFSFLFISGASCPISAQVRIQNADPVIDNGILRIKLDLSRGGAIAYISLSRQDRNIVNIADEGRYIQQSYYAGKAVDRKKDGQSPHWSPWSWNPIQVGDAFRHRAKIVSFRKRKNSFYVKCIPMLWDMNNRPAEAEIEQWTSLEGNVIKGRNRLTCHRQQDPYGDSVVNDQELPAVYPVSALKNLYAYLGDKPFSIDTLSNPVVVNLSGGFWGRYSNVSEHWMAFLDDQNWGIGVYNPRCMEFLAGRSGVPDKEASDGSTSYIAPVKKEMLLKNTVYEYEYDLIVGNLEEIRRGIYALHANP